MFSFTYDVYNSIDPKLTIFYNYGNWLTVENPLYHELRPQPDIPGMNTETFKGFLDQKGINFIITQNGFNKFFPGLKEIFLDYKLEGFEPILHQGNIHVLKRKNISSTLDYS